MSGIGIQATPCGLSTGGRPDRSLAQGLAGRWLSEGSVNQDAVVMPPFPLPTSDGKYEQWLMPCEGGNIAAEHRPAVNPKLLSRHNALTRYTRL
jgi:hypothetical protein